MGGLYHFRGEGKREPRRDTKNAKGVGETSKVLKTYEVSFSPGYKHSTLLPLESMLQDQRQEDLHR
jgi:hypothetical protein